MLGRFKKRSRAVRFGTEKTVGFRALTVIFDSAVTRDSFAFQGGVGCGGEIPRIQIELSRC